jgi:hypothetical protein
MTWPEFAAAHPWWSVAFLVVAWRGVSWVMAAAVEPLKSWRRPNDCPRCNGTGRLP